MSSDGQNPLYVYRELITLLEYNRFDDISTVDDMSDDNRYITRLKFVRQITLRPEYVSPVVEVVGIPMGQHFFVIHAIVCHSADDCVKIEIRTNEDMDSVRRKLMDEFVVKLSELLSVSINDLPIELKLKILSLLPIESVLKMSSVSTVWREITLDDQLWRILVEQHFPTSYSRGLNGEDWKSIYREAFRNQKLLERQKSRSPSREPTPAYHPILGARLLPAYGPGIGYDPNYGGVGQWPPPYGGADLDPLGRAQGGMIMDPRAFPGPFGRGPRNPAPGLPPGAIPPGARFDPFGPPGVGPNPNPHRNPRQQGPDPDHLPPPGYDDMFM